MDDPPPRPLGLRPAALDAWMTHIEAAILEPVPNERFTLSSHPAGPQGLAGDTSG